MDMVMPAAMSFSLLFSHSEAADPLRELILILNSSPAFEYILKDTILSRGFTILPAVPDSLPMVHGHIFTAEIDYNNSKGE